MVLLAINMFALVVRLYHIQYPSSVVFDEVHFGGFATKYIKGAFFMDVHPPLAKMLFALDGWLAGFKGDFDFKDIGMDYLEPGVPYVAMRMMPALLGIGLVNTTFLTLRASGCSPLTSMMAAFMVTFENALLTNARLILLDSPLITFTGLTALAFQKFSYLDEQSAKQLSGKWWLWLTLTGLFLGATVSVKWVGLFTIAWVGTMTLFQLFTNLGNLHIPLPKFGKTFAARVLCLIVLPILFYMAMFAIHFKCLVNPGEGDGFMSSEFQSTLNGKAKDPTMAPVFLGSRVTIKHWNTQGGYLHSHAHNYPAGSKQQQITLYPHRDANNDWTLLNETSVVDPLVGEPIRVQDGMILKLWHPVTKKRLHSHDVKPIVTEVDWQNEVSAYGFDGFDGDANDYFKLEIVPEYTEAGEARVNLTAIRSRFRLIHVMTGGALFSHKVKLPAWGFEQQEVTCNKQGTIPNSIWYIETNEHENAPADAPILTYKNPGFFGKFWELNKVMWTTNAGLVESHNWDSRPTAWPVLSRGINFWGKDMHHVYLIGNAFVWALATGGILAYFAFKALLVLRWQRGYKDYTTVRDLFGYDLRTATFVLGWAFHYLPFFLMERQLFLHHYFPALYFSILAFAQLFDFGAKRVTANLVLPVSLGIIVASVAVFYNFAPLAYGLQWTKSECEAAQWRSTWDFDCGTYPETYEAYYNGAQQTSVAAAKVSPAPAAAAPVENVVPVEEVPVDTHIAEPEADPVPSPKAERPQPPSMINGQSVSYSTSQQTIYQDEQGNILDPEAVKKMQNVQFVTRYDTIMGDQPLPASVSAAAAKLAIEKVQGELAQREANTKVEPGEEDPVGGEDSGRRAPAAAKVEL
ncbi:Dolichyl-phosphate-mannose-protein mannosyltransferase-domain-containing protein [Protomyces lactucae-debilis]|uniref:Dolichyl-phosphate-mannose--protein mannosyltransferase n=1 Tax=Protomyces lactucae-debilis TaxID=2754530 RepID=A0A1Y2EYC6_PROLT|nr:Dolichyl-phosphate-mannose-protein mannosyltransferase-domain-containing protein [Protomyces lactucae-debilis]ORY76622.1 Dolichyl-phosphate-mannose-protein mannosyltransferase-domain-containing protein [Protomyces lactucae-debilis]